MRVPPASTVKGRVPWSRSRQKGGERNRGVEPRTPVDTFTTKPTRHRFTQEQLAIGRRRGNITRWGTNQLLNPVLKDDPAIKRYQSHIAARRGNAGKVSRTSQIVSRSAPRAFLEYLGLPIGPDSVTRLIVQTREEHRADNYQTDEKLLAFALNPPKGRYNKAATLKGVFKANHCPLIVSLPTPEPPKRTKKISAEVMKAIYQALPIDELRVIIDLQAYAGERVAALCTLTPISDWTDHGRK